MRTTDPVGTALASIAAGATTGAAAIALGTLVVRLTQERGTSAPPEDGAAFLGASLFLGIVLAAATGWQLTRAVDDLWRRGVTAAIAVFGASLLAIVAMPVDTVAGWRGLVAYVLVLAAGAVASARTARRNAAR